MPADLHKARELFLHAVGTLPPAQWEEYVDQATGGDAELARQVRHLLQVHLEAGSFLEQPVAGLGATGDFLPTPAEGAGGQVQEEGPGTVIGPYKLLEVIGEGGFGLVYMADQQQPVRRKVALKILKPGMNTWQVIARFEAERQALAVMDHPHIAKVFEAGTTATGRPYFVMELVKGLPLTTHCDQAHLTTRQRLELFVHVCQAVQHAHQKGIIHRDLKPSNVLVSRHDTTPLVKVIDFGIAKALGQTLTDKTFFTGFAQMIGTPLYMSPEQAGMSDLDIDTRSDIYSLGVLLYELLTGSTPFDKDRFKKAAYDEIRRILREEEPPKPSTRLAESKDTLPSISAQRQTEPAKLSKLVTGELDWIVMKALEKDRNRRYETANDLAMDLQRYLDGEPVSAHPPSATYRLRKFVRRHRGLVIGASVVAGTVFLGLLAVILTLSLSNERIAQEKKLAAQERDRALKNRYAMVKAVFEMLEPLQREEWNTDPRLSKARAAMLDHAARQFQHMVDQDRTDRRFRREVGCAFHAVALIYGSFGARDKSIKAYQVSISLLAELTDDLGQDSYAQNILAKDYYNLGHELLIAGRRDDALVAFQSSAVAHLRMAESVGDCRSLADTAWILAGCPLEEGRGDPAVALGLAQKAVELKRDLHQVWNTLGVAYYRAGQLDHAYQALEAAMRRHPRGGEGFIWLYLAMIAWDRGDKEEARRWYQKTLDWLPQPNPGAHPVELTNILGEAAAKLGVPAPKIP